MIFAPSDYSVATQLYEDELDLQILPSQAKMCHHAARYLYIIIAKNAEKWIEDDDFWLTDNFISSWIIEIGVDPKMAYWTKARPIH